MSSSKHHFNLILAINGILMMVLCMNACSSSISEKMIPIQVDSIAQEPLIPAQETTIPLRDSIIHFGMQLLGVPYVTAASNVHGFDCSGFVYYVFKHFNISVPRSTSQYAHFGVEMNIDSAQKGDLLIFLSPTRNAIGHIGIITHPKGMETDFIHASSGREMQVIISSLKQEGYKRRFVKVVRVI